MKKKLIIGALILVVVGLIAFLIVRGLLIPEAKIKPNANGNPVEKIQEKHLYPAYNRIQNEYKWGYIDNNGEFVISPKFDKAEDFMENGLARVYSGEKVGLLDKSGKIVLNTNFQYITDFSEGRAITNKENSYVVIDEKGKTVFSSPYEINAFHEGFAVCAKDAGEGKRVYGYIDRQGKYLFQPQFTFAYEFNGGKALAKIKEKEYVVIDNTGKIISRLNYNNIRDLSEDIMVFSDEKNEKSGYIKVDGQILIQPKFVRAEKFEKGYAIVNAAENYYDNMVGLMNVRGEYTIKTEYSDVLSIGEGLYSVSEKADSGMAPFAKKAVAFSDGRFLTGFDYYDIGDFKNGYITVSDDKATYFIDGNGRRAASLPMVNGRGRMSFVGELIKAEVDEQLAYYTKDGKVIWQSENAYKLKNGAVVKETKFRPDVYMLIRYPQISGHPDKSVEEKINKKLKEIFIGDKTGSKKEEEKYIEDISAGYEVGNIENLLSITKNEYAYFFGAAHGMPFMEAYYININTGKFYKLGELFKKNSKYVEKLNVIVKELIKEKRKEPDPIFFYEPFGGISSEEGFIIGEDKIQLFFQPYEIAPYSEGFPIFDIPYSKINNIIDKEGDFWKSFNKNIM